ncbi:MAG: YihY/virulence factor BrkB family protein [Desulfobacteraceae bacterium]|nr:YihY/virulence factor BrkB family protein [Desulfobacteraceae bacterium]
MNRISQWSHRIVRFLDVGIWQVRVMDLSGFSALQTRWIRIMVLAVKGFTKDNCPLRASALTFFTLLSIVPVFAMAFGIAKGFGFEKIMEREVLNQFSGQEAVLIRIIEFAHTLLESTKGSLIAGIGILLLFWSVIKVLFHIESTLNSIWETQPRTIIRKFSDYLSIMLICPILVIISGSTTVFIKTQVTAITGKFHLLELLGPVIFLGLKLAPFMLIWILFTLIYMVMPNTVIRFRSALAAGIIAGTIYQFAQGLYINFQILVAQYNAIYGSFAALPLFLVWIQVSWMIVLMGAEISYAHQNEHAYERSAEFSPLNPRLEIILALKITHCIVNVFTEGKAPMSAEGLSTALDIPLRPLRHILSILVTSGVLSEIDGRNNKQSPGYQPAMDVNNITIAFVMDRVVRRGRMNSMPFLGGQDLMANSLDELKRLVDGSPANKLLKDM